MSNELEDVVVIDKSEGKIFNFGRFIPPDSNELELELMDNLDFDDLLNNHQTRYGIVYFSAQEIQVYTRSSALTGGHYRPIRHLTTLLKLPLLKSSTN